MCASYASTKYIKQTVVTKKLKVKVISSKVQLHEHRPKRLRFQIGRNGDRSPATVEGFLRAKPKRSEDVKARNIPQEMKGILHNPTTNPNNPSSETRRCPRTPATNLRRISETVQGRPQATDRWDRRGSSSHQGEQSVEASSCGEKSKHDSPPRRRGNVLYRPVSPLIGKIIPTLVASPKRPARRTPVRSPTKRPLKKAAVAAAIIPSRPFEAFFKDKVVLPMNEISRNSETVNGIVQNILEEVRKKDKRFALEILNSGSYYEHLKVSHPREFDVMLVFEAYRIGTFFSIEYPVRLRDSSVGFAKLKFKDHVTGGRGIWDEFLTKDGKYLSPRKTVDHFHRLVRKAVKSMKTSQRTRISNIRNGNESPAVTLTIDGKIDLDLVVSLEILEWPKCANAWGNFATNKTSPTQSKVEEIKMREPKFHLVAKHCPSEKDIPPDSQVYWRISFSVVEKTLLRPSGSGKKYFRIAKAIFEAMKERFHPLTSFHLKTLFLHLHYERPRAKSNDSVLGESVVRFFESLIDRLVKGRLPHFFVRNLNLFAEMSQNKRTAHLAAELTRVLVKPLVQNPERFLRSLRL